MITEAIHISHYFPKLSNQLKVTGTQDENLLVHKNYHTVIIWQQTHCPA